VSPIQPGSPTDAVVEQLAQTVLRLASEVWALKEERLAMEALADADGRFSFTDLNDFRPTPAVEERIREARAEFVARVFEPSAPIGALGR
jgi:hypothetical protein